MNKKTLVLLVGETGAGKDTVVNKLPFPKVISYKASSMRNSDIEGVTHYFVSDEEMDEIEKRDDIIASTNTGGIRYCATADQLKDDVTIYVINPEGVRWFNEHYKNDDLQIIIIGLFVSLEIRKSRCRTRTDFETTFMSRVKAEQEDYNKFRLNGEFDYLIKNTDSNKTATMIYDIIRKEITYDNRIKARLSSC